MRIIFSEHALSRLWKRPTITRQMVIQAIKSPDSVRISYRGRNLFRKKFGDKAIEVITTTENDTMVVITQYPVDEL